MNNIAAMEVPVQRHLGHHSGWHSEEHLSAAECYHLCQCHWNCSCQKKKQVQLYWVTPTTFFQWSWKYLAPWVSAPRSSWHKSRDIWPRRPGLLISQYWYRYQYYRRYFLRLSWLSPILFVRSIEMGIGDTFSAIFWQYSIRVSIITQSAPSAHRRK